MTFVLFGSFIYFFAPSQVVTFVSEIVSSLIKPHSGESPVLTGLGRAGGGMGVVPYRKNRDTH
jgi:hypothetical protein